MISTCKNCGCELHLFKGDWVDGTGGDVCGVDGDNAPHESILEESPYIALRGNLTEGFVAFGPYENFDQAAFAHEGDECWIMELKPNSEINTKEPDDTP